MTRFENVGVFIREKMWLENSLIQYEGGWQGSGGPDTTLSPSFILAESIFEPNLFPYKYSNIFKPSHLSYLSAYEDGTGCSETSEYKILTPGNYPEESIQEPRYVYLSEAKASHAHRTWTEVSTSVAHFLQMELLLSPIYIYSQGVMSSKRTNNNPGLGYWCTLINP